MEALTASGRSGLGSVRRRGLHPRHRRDDGVPGLRWFRNPRELQEARPEGVRSLSCLPGLGRCEVSRDHGGGIVMPWEFFECPDGEKILIERCCEKGGCRMTERCVSRPTCILFSRSGRQGKGKISTTQALNGTRLAYLQIVTPFSERPCDRAFALLGTFHHLKHQKLELHDALMEEGLEDSDSTGIFDVYGGGDGG